MELKRKHPWLWQRGHTYYLRAKVPVDLVDLFGSREVKKSLRTTDLRQAASLVQTEAHALQLRFDELRTSSAASTRHLAIESARDVARRWFTTRHEAEDFQVPPVLDEDRRGSLLDDLRREMEALTHGEPFEVGRSVSEAMRLIGVDTSNRERLWSRVVELSDLLIRARRELIELKLAQLAGDYSDTIRDSLFRAPGTKPDTSQMARSPNDGSAFLFALEPWRDFLRSRGMKSRQLRQYELDLMDFASRAPSIKDVKRNSLQKFYEEELSHLAPNTVIRKFSPIRSYWRYLQTHELVPLEAKPFEGLLLPKKKALTKRREWSPVQVCSLWLKAEARSDVPLAQAIRIAAFTGGRIEAVCSLSKTDVFEAADGRLALRFSDKTEAGIRDVPVHSAIEPMMRRMMKSADTRGGFLIRSDAANQYQDRSTGIGKRFSRLKTDLGFEKGYDFHSIRRTVVDLLSKALCPEAVAADIVGHEKPTMTYGLYRKTSDIADKRRWIEAALVYPDEAFMKGHQV